MAKNVKSLAGTTIETSVKTGSMETIVQNMPGYRMNEYMLVLVPHEELRNRIMLLKKEFAEKYQSSFAVWGKPHLMLAKFTQYEMMEERIVHRLKTIGMGYHPLKVELKDFGSFPTHSIYVNVTSKEPIRNLVKEIKDAQRLMKIDNEHKPHFMDEPNFIIGRRLLPWQFEKGWLEYSNRHFTGRFVADSMMLLKRREGEKAWQIAQRFEFQNLPVSTRQGELFF